MPDADHGLVDAEVVHLAEHHGDRVGLGVDVLGDVLEHVLRRGSPSSLDSSSIRPARRKPYQLFFEPSGMPIIRSITPTSVGKLMGPD